MTNAHMITSLRKGSEATSGAYRAWRAARVEVEGACGMHLHHCPVCASGRECAVLPAMQAVLSEIRRSEEHAARVDKVWSEANLA